MDWSAVRYQMTCRPQQHYFGQSRSADHLPGPGRCNIIEPLFWPDHTDPPAGSFAVTCPETITGWFHRHKGVDIFDRNPDSTGATSENVCNDPAVHHCLSAIHCIFSEALWYFDHDIKS